MQETAFGALATASGMLVLAMLALLRAGLQHGRFRGWHWWVAAIVLGGGGVALAPFSGGQRWAAAGVQAMLLSWPVLTLIGLRRFHGRLGLPGNERADWLVLGGGVIVVVLAAVTPPDTVSGLLLPGAMTMLTHLYVAAVIGSSRTAEDVGALRVLAATVALAALVPALGWGAGQVPAGFAGTVTRAMTAAFCLNIVCFTMLNLMRERTERELHESRRRLRVLANTDPLTSVPNRRHFQDLANRVLQDAAPGPDAPVLLLFDVDHFKLINDKFGHAAGDRALRLVGRCMQDALRAHDLAGRLGGDEFALLLDGTTIAQAICVADRIVRALQDQSPEHRLPCVGLSFGVVQAVAGESVDDALRRADQALYEAKRQGRSRVVAAAGAEEEPVFSESKRLGLT
ncbi:MAG: GGDEF domain-containing protein [Rubrivivax sp.]